MRAFRRASAVESLSIINYELVHIHAYEKKKYPCNTVDINVLILNGARKIDELHVLPDVGLQNLYIMGFVSPPGRKTYILQVLYHTSPISVCKTYLLRAL